MGTADTGACRSSFGCKASGCKGDGGEGSPCSAFTVGAGPALMGTSSGAWMGAPLGTALSKFAEAARRADPSACQAVAPRSSFLALSRSTKVFGACECAGCNGARSTRTLLTALVLMGGARLLMGRAAARGGFVMGLRRDGCARREPKLSSKVLARSHVCSRRLRLRLRTVPWRRAPVDAYLRISATSCAILAYPQSRHHRRGVTAGHL